MSKNLTSAESMAQWQARVDAGLCGDCGGSNDRGEGVVCRACFHRHYCLGSFNQSCVCPEVTECGNRSCHAPAVAVLTCCGRVYARCAAHGGMVGAVRSRAAHRGLHECQKPGRAGAGKAVR